MSETMTDGPEKFDSWAIVEVMGHKKYAGRVTEQQIAGAGLVRVDVPISGRCSGSRSCWRSSTRTRRSEGHMPKFRKKPVVIEAVQLRWDTWGEMCDFLGREFFSDGGCGAQDGPAIGLDIPTLEGTLHASENDWIIRGVKGELYPCKPDIFEATYEPADLRPEDFGARGDEP